MLCIDETTDVSVLNELVVYGRYIIEGGLKNSFLRIIEWHDGRADAIIDATMRHCSDLQLDVLHTIYMGLEVTVHL